MPPTKDFIGKAVFLLHGDNGAGLYKLGLPALTVNGRRAVLKLAKEGISSLIPLSSMPHILSSPHPSAIKTANLIKERLGISYEKITLQPLLGPAKIIDEEAGGKIFDEYQEKGLLDTLYLVYNNDERFNNPKIIDPKNSVELRFADFIGSLPGRMLLMNRPPCFICISHYEVLHLLVKKLFALGPAENQPLKFGEVIELSFFERNANSDPENRQFLLESSFRGKTVENTFRKK